MHDGNANEMVGEVTTEFLSFLWADPSRRVGEDEADRVRTRFHRCMYGIGTRQATDFYEHDRLFSYRWVPVLVSSATVCDGCRDRIKAEPTRAP